MSRPKEPLKCGHVDQPYHGGGICARCYKREWLREYRLRAKCTEPGCERRVHARDVCRTHYFTRYQDTTPKGPGKQHGSLYPQAIVRVKTKGWGCGPVT